MNACDFGEALHSNMNETLANFNLIVEGNVIVPKVMQANVGLPPFFTVVALLAGATLYGVARALLALPLAAALRVYLQRLVVPAIQKK